tara:strand:+ start:2232 stop:2498 length:267 start_codon:yes stop_codon:yes gene_type:complete
MDFSNKKKRIGKPNLQALQREVPLAGALILLLYVHQTLDLMPWVSLVFAMSLLFFAMHHFLAWHKRFEKGRSDWPQPLVSSSAQIVFV